MLVTANMTMFVHCDIAQHDLCEGVSVRIGPRTGERIVKLCMCSCHNTTIKDVRTERKLPNHTAEPTQIKLPLSGVTFAY